jgi:NhaP-type Na+/H+ or K+/H+ antiporter
VIVACILAMCSYLCLPFNWSMNYNFLFGSIMCATDPVSVVSLLKSAKASSALSNIIAGGKLACQPLCPLYVMTFSSLPALYDRA